MFGQDREFDGARFCGSAKATASLSINLHPRSLAVEVIHVDKVASIFGAPTGTSPYEHLPNTGSLKRLTHLPIRHRAIREFRKPRWFHSSADQMWDPDPARFQSWLYQVRTEKTRDGAGVMSFTGHWVSLDQEVKLFLGRKNMGFEAMDPQKPKQVALHALYPEPPRLLC